MPVISRFCGMIIKMYFRQSEHNPPHFHVKFGKSSNFQYQENVMIEGDLPKKEQKFINEWVDLHQEELMEIWETQEFKKLAPLK